jgi:hypothetical protein
MAGVKDIRAAVAEARIRAAETLRRTHISNAFMAFRSRPELAQMERECLDDMSVSAQAARDRLLAKLGEGAEPLNSGVRHVNVGDDARDKRVAAASAAILVRCGLQQDPETKKPVAFDGANPFRGATLSELVTDVLAASNVDVRAYDREERAALALGGRVKGMQTTSDFPVILENTLHKLMLTGFQAITPVYVRFCKIGDVSDLRDWNRLVPGLMGSLEVVNEHGEYKNKNIPDAEKEAIRAKRRGNILSITPEVIINDDIGYVADMARGVGMIGGRSVDRTVFELLAQNSGNGPVLKKTGNTLFHADHGNLADSGAAPSVATLAAAADAMAQQKAPGEDQEFLDISPAVALSSHSLAREIQVLRLIAAGRPIREIAVIGLPDDHWGEVVTAVVVLTPQGRLDHEGMRSFCDGKLARMEVPKRLVLVDELPRTFTGKIDKVRIRKLLLDATPSLP